MGAPLGNQNGAKAKVWTAAIERALERRGDPSINPDDPPRSARAKGLDDMADKFLETVLLPTVGIQGFKEIGDRLDGKAAQTLQGPDGTNLFQPVVDAARLLQTKLR